MLFQTEAYSLVLIMINSSCSSSSIRAASIRFSLHVIFFLLIYSMPQNSKLNCMSVYCPLKRNKMAQHKQVLIYEHHRAIMF